MADPRIEADGRLVEEQDPRVGDQRARDLEPAALTAAVALDRPVDELAESERSAQLGDPGLLPAPASTPHRRACSSRLRGRSGRGRRPAPGTRPRDRCAPRAGRARRRSRRASRCRWSARSSSSASRSSSTCRRRSGRAGRTPRRRRPSKLMPFTASTPPGYVLRQLMRTSIVAGRSSWSSFGRVLLHHLELTDARPEHVTVTFCGAPLVRVMDIREADERQRHLRRAVRAAPRAPAGRRVPDARLDRRGRGRGAGGVAAAQPLRRRRGRQPRRLADDRRRADLLDMLRARRRAHEDYVGSWLPEPVVTRDERRRPRAARRCWPTRSGSRCWSCSRRSRPRSGSRSCCTTCSASRSTRSRRSSTAARGGTPAREPRAPPRAGRARSPTPS